MSEQQQNPTRASGDEAGERSDVGDDPKHPHPQDHPRDHRSSSDGKDGKVHDDSPVDRYRDSPGLAVATETDDVPEPNEPG